MKKKAKRKSKTYTLDLDGVTVDYLRRVVKLSGYNLDTVITVLLSLEIEARR